MDIRRSSFNFPATEDDGSQTATAQLSFPREVLRAAIGIVGYSATYENHQDHHLGRLTVEVNTSVNGSDRTKVDVSGVFGLRDWSGEWDDPYSGVVDYAVFAKLAAVAPPPPAGSRNPRVRKSTRENPIEFAL